MRCVRCHRQLLKIAATVGNYLYGPKCARLTGLTQRKERKPQAFSRATAQPDARQLRLAFQPPADQPQPEEEDAT